MHMIRKGQVRWLAKGDLLGLATGHWPLQFRNWPPATGH
jgi:hypothetical protein